MTAAVLGEVLWIRDHADLAAMAAYERRYGVIAESDLSGRQDAEQATEITAGEFEEVWALARPALRAAQLPRQTEAWETPQPPNRSSGLLAARGK